MSNLIIRIKLQDGEIALAQMSDGLLMSGQDIKGAIELDNKTFFIQLNNKEVELQYGKNKIVQPPLVELEKINIL